MPCQVPSASAPAITGTWSETLVSMDFTCAGMSSGPSTSWIQPASAGARRPSAVARSVRTSGSAFSWMTSEAEVWRMKMSSTPSFAPASRMNRVVSRVISVNPAPLVSTVTVAVAMISGTTLVMDDKRPVTAAASTRSSGLLHVFLQRRDHVDQAAPDLLDEGHDPVEIGVVGQLQPRLLRLGGRRVRLCRARQGQIVRDEFLLERDVLALQPRDLGLERGALVRGRLASPADRPAGTDRYLAGAPVEPQIAVVGAAEAVACVVAIRRRILRPSRRPDQCKSNADQQDRADHGVSPRIAVHRRWPCGSTMAPWRGVRRGVSMAAYHASRHARENAVREPAQAPITC